MKQVRHKGSNFPAMVKDETCMESITTDFRSSTFQQMFNVDENEAVLMNSRYVMIWIILLSWFWEGRWLSWHSNSGFKMVSTSVLKGPSNFCGMCPHRWWYKMLDSKWAHLKFKCRTFQTNRSGRKKRGGWIATPKCMRDSLSMSLCWICSAPSFQFLHPQNARRETFIDSVFWRPYFLENQYGISWNQKK